MLNSAEMTRSNPQTERTYSIGQLAEEFGLTLRSLRFYEDEGLISPARVGQTRVYTHRDRARLKLICRGKRLGFSIGEIKDFLDLYDTDEAQVEQMTFLLKGARNRIVHLEQQLRDVQQTLKELREIDDLIVSHLHAKGVSVQSD
ncbi:MULTISPECIES: MerR family DNA-binding transcriptional regulator [unclassified Azospirillum]|uniref:MerR family transcriptional regulator n=1 Tax=unclassified Azospirillum TaxID=2630922 RepID=UPI000B6A7416|nr:MULTISPECIES: MerR family DNA-binding transcriptional regulator [unclassified Azospirillum]SNR99604.1 DNA-binding transcriptional regulator, MerR family [Azospirillum sp. RU38E]SNS17116.1 DNA-binding transcriptional regulator, MerR family [Azospirillum sp. RU37A]